MHRLALILTGWVFVAWPLLCLGGVLPEVCECQDACPSCRTDSLPGHHGCHHDACRVKAIGRADAQDDDPSSGLAVPIALAPDSAESLSKGAIALLGLRLSETQWLIIPSAAPACVLPLLV